MAHFSTEVDIEPSEFIDNCSSEDIKELVDILIDEGYLDGEPVTSPIHHNLLEQEWIMMISKLMKSRLLLSNEEEMVIRNIANRF